MQSQPDFGQSGGTLVEGGESRNQRKIVHSSLTSLQGGWVQARFAPLLTPLGEVVGRNHTKWASIEVCATPPHFPPDPTERLLSPRTASTPRTQKAADGGRKSTQTAQQSEWTKQRKNCKMSEREQHFHFRVNEYWCGNNSPDTVQNPPET